MEIPIEPIDQLLERVLCVNILSSDYFKVLYSLKNYHQVVDEIYNQVSCGAMDDWELQLLFNYVFLLYKFFTMKLKVKQMHALLKHPNSPYIRAVEVLGHLSLTGKNQQFGLMLRSNKECFLD